MTHVKIIRFLYADFRNENDTQSLVSETLAKYFQQSLTELFHNMSTDI